MRNFRILPLMATVFLAGAFLFAGCEKEKKTEKNKCEFCKVENPLVELAWLKAKAEYYSQHPETHSSITSCKYDTDKEGFIIADCETCPDWGVCLYACDGTYLCHFAGLMGRPCENHTIDTSSYKIIYRNY